MEDLRIIETTFDDLKNIVALWNDGDVMKYVGFPYGLNVTIETLNENWLPNINKSDKRKHYSIYHKDLGYCGECHYRVDEQGETAMDIKLFEKARGRGIAYAGLKFALEKAFDQGKAKICYVDPQRINAKAITLYEKMGFIEMPHPNKEIGINHLYFEIDKERFTQYNH